ncbi:MAG: FGGY-family carbohydrate kinase [Acidimicrobiales bacterium]|nr:FGGY-family carbohydrate kinase [Acidimicrobiales bacterium]
MTEPHLLTIDLGTSGPKAAVVTSTARLVGTARASVTTAFGAGGSAEQDAEQVWQAVLDAAREALHQAAVPPASVVGVVASAQYSSIVPVAADGLPVAPMITWMDQRGVPKKIKRLPGHPRRGDPPQTLLRFLRVHGLAPVSSGMSINHMRWFRFAQPDAYGLTAAFLEPVDYLVARFTGRLTANQCSSFMQMLADNRTVPSTGWDDGLVGASMIDRDRLPEPVATGSVVGPVLPAVAEALGLQPGTPVLSGINDTQAGAVAAGIFSGTPAGLALGTTSVIVAPLHKKKVNPLRSLYAMPSPLGGSHLLSAENGPAGAAVDYMLDQVVYPDDAFGTLPSGQDRYRAFDEAGAASPPGANGVLFLPWLRGSIAPQADGRMRGGFLDVGLDTTRNDLARAVLEGVALNLRWLQSPVETFLGNRIDHYAFYGGGARSDLWSAVMADVLGKPVHQLAGAGYSNSIGTALFGFHHLGLASATDHKPEIRRVYEPEPAHRARYETLAGVFADAFKRTRPLVHRLSRHH